MTLGSVVTGTGKWKPVQRIVLRWSALTAVGATPAVWVVDGRTMTVSLKAIVVEGYETGQSSSRAASNRTTASSPRGRKLLSPGQTVTFEEEGLS